MMSHDNLQAFIASNMSLMIHQGITLTEIESMLPWERHILLGMIKDHVEKLAQKQQKESQQMARG